MLDNVLGPEHVDAALPLAAAAVHHSAHRFLHWVVLM